MYTKRGYMASKSKCMKFNIRPCLLPGRKNININYAFVMHELLNAFYKKSKGFSVSYSILRIKRSVTKDRVPFQFSTRLHDCLVFYGFLPTDLVLNFKLLK